MTKRTLKDLMEDISAEIRTTSGGRIDFRTTMGRTTKSFIKKASDEHAKETLDAATKAVDKAAEATPAAEVPDKTIKKN